MWSGGNGKSALKSLHLLPVSKVLPTKYMSQYEEVTLRKVWGHSLKAQKCIISAFPFPFKKDILL